MNKDDKLKKASSMEVKFLMARDTLNYGLVEEGETKTVTIEDGKAFCRNGVAKEIKGGK